MKLPYIPQIVAARPVILLTGFLGAGKTTFLRQLLLATQKAGVSADVILNDYADAKLDSATLEGLAASIEPLTATCACCEGLDYLLKLSMKSAKSESDVLLVELNGTADPVPIVESFTLMENKLQLHPRWQVCIIDARHFGQRGAYRDIEELQLQTASHIYFSHLSGAQPPEDVLGKVREMNPHATVVSKEEFIKVVLAKVKAKKHILTGENSENNSKISQISDKYHKTHEFTACQILLPHAAPEGVIKNWLEDIPSGVIRIKALMGITGKPGARYLFERVADVISRDPQEVLLGKNVPNSAILIGPDLDLDALQKLAENHLND